MTLLVYTCCACKRTQHVQCTKLLAALVRQQPMALRTLCGMFTIHRKSASMTCRNASWHILTCRGQKGLPPLAPPPSQTCNTPKRLGPPQAPLNAVSSIAQDVVYLSTLSFLSLFFITDLHCSIHARIENFDAMGREVQLLQETCSGLSSCKARVGHNTS